MKLNDNPGLKREHILAMLLLAVVLIAAQIYLMKYLKEQNMALARSHERAAAARASLEANSNAIIQYKTTVKVDKNELPSPVESQNRMYSALMNAFSARGLEGVNVEKTTESGQEVSFRVSGTLPYTSVFNVLSSFRQAPYLVKITDLSLDGDKNNSVRFAFTVTAVAEKAEGEKKTDEKH